MNPLWTDRLGLPPKAAEPGIAFVAENATDFQPYVAFLQDMRRQNPRLGMVLVLRDAADLTALPASLAGLPCHVLPARIAATLFLSRLRVRAIALVQPLGQVPPALARAARARAIPVTGLSHDTTASDLLAMVGQERAWKDRRDRPVARYIANVLAAKVARGELSSCITRYNTLADLKTALGRNDTILCLGNGPTSEDPRTLDFAQALVFRANHTWAARQHFTKPDMVFTGVQAAMKQLRGPIMAVLGETAEKVLLMVRGPALVTAPLHYCVADKLVPALTEFDWGLHRPTSGAVMVATAVALKPRQLVIAGFDLFSHVAGAYPGAAPAANAYTASHNGEKEALFLRHVLSGYKGELIILSPALATLVQGGAAANKASDSRPD